MCDTTEIKKEIEQLLQQADSLEQWTRNNIKHTDFEKVRRELNAVNVKIRAKQQRIERHTNTKNSRTIQVSQEYSLPFKYQ